MDMDRLLWFPTLYPDELLYSAFARYHVRSGNTSPKITTEELFGKRTIRSVWDLPANLVTLLERMDSDWNVEKLIFNHTMYSYYAAFLQPSQAEQVKQSMKDGKGGTIHTRIGVSASNVKIKTKLWMCSTCIKEDINAYGETYWRRVHQAPGVFLCPKHETVLEETTISVKSENQHEYIIATPYIERSVYNLNGLGSEEMQQLLRIAQVTESLLLNSHLQTNTNTIRNKYLVLLKQKEYASLNGFVKRDRLFLSFRTKFSEECLNLLQSPVTLDESNWLTMIFQKHRKSFHPLRHILIMLFLEIELSHLLKKEQYYPFGQGPWFCLNVACADYQKPIITSLAITICYDTKKPVGTFRCNCGFIFSRRGPDNSKDDWYRIGTIKDYGDIWKEKLSRLVTEGNSLKEIAMELQADRATVKKYATELNLKVPWKLPKVKQNRSEVIVEDYETQLKERKNRWMELQELYPEKSKTELRRIAPDVYTYLYRNERDWLNDFSPVKTRMQTPNQRVDWEERDTELLKQVKEVIRTWEKDSEKPTKIAVTSIGKKINKLSLLQKYADKLPKTMNFISKVSEDVATFQKRRVMLLIEELKEQNEPIIEWQIYKLAGLRPNISNDVKRFISLKVTEYESTKK